MFYLANGEAGTGKVVGADPPREPCCLWICYAFPTSTMSKSNGSASRSFSSLPENNLGCGLQLESHYPYSSYHTKIGKCKILVYGIMDAVLTMVRMSSKLPASEGFLTVKVQWPCSIHLPIRNSANRRPEAIMQRKDPHNPNGWNSEPSILEKSWIIARERKARGQIYGLIMTINKVLSCHCYCFIIPNVCGCKKTSSS